MTTKPKARKFRIRRSPGATDPALPHGSGDATMNAHPGDDGLRDRPAAQGQAPQGTAPHEQSPHSHPPRPQSPRPQTQPGAIQGHPAQIHPAQATQSQANRGHPSTQRTSSGDDFAANQPESLAERRAQALERLRTEGQDEAHPTRPTQARAPMGDQPAPEPLHPRSLPPRGGAPRYAPGYGQPSDAQPAAQPSARDAQVSSAGEVRAEADLDAIRKEGLTGRQLRMARRVAQKHGLAPTSDFDAVRLLRARGIDPFKRANMLEVLPQNGNRTMPAPSEEKVSLPQTVPAGGNLPSTHHAPPPPGGLSDRRQREIMEIQRDIARRRQRRTLQLLVRLAFFVFLPTLLAGYYYYRVATPMYAAKSEFLILQADATSSGALGGLLSGTQFATNQDSIAVQSYLQSKDAMVRLNEDQGFANHFANPEIDPIQRLPENPSTEEAYSVYKKYVQIGYDPTEGVIKMEVAAEDPQTAREFSTQLIAYAEQRVDELSLRKRDDAMQSARESLERAKAERREAQEALVRLQEGTLVDPEAVIATLRTQISTYEIQLQEKELQLAALMDNARPNQARVDGVQADITRLNALLDRLNSRMTEARSNGASLAADTAQIQMAQADLATADLFLQSALQNEKQTELEANRQVRYLTTSVRPVAPEDPSYPRAFENTILVFLVLSGAYLMISLTMAILREQVSS